MIRALFLFVLDIFAFLTFLSVGLAFGGGVMALIVG